MLPLRTEFEKMHLSDAVTLGGAYDGGGAFPVASTGS